MSDLTTAATVLAAALALAKPIVESGCRLIEQLLGEPCQVARGMLADRLYMRQWQNRIKMAARAQELLDASKIAARVLPGGFLLPLLDRCATAEEPTLQEMWSRLLCSGVESAKYQHPAFVRILSDLTLDEALILKSPSPRVFLMAEGSTPFTPLEGDVGELICLQSGPNRWVNVPLCLKMMRDRIGYQSEELSRQIDVSQLEPYATHLESLGIVTIEREWPFEVNEYLLRFKDTEFGKRFVEACTGTSISANTFDGKAAVRADV